MPKFAANLSMMFNEHTFLDRFAAARDAGFEAVEFLFPYAQTPQTVADQLQGAGLTQALFNMPPGDWDGGERGLASLPGREVDFQKSLDLALPYAEALNCRRIHMMAGIVPPGADLQAHESCYLSNLVFAAERTVGQGIEILIEPINGRDMPGYFLNRLDQARRLIERAGQPNVKLQFDFYHTQITHGDLIMNFRQYQAITGHVQVAGVPERHEPDTGEVNYQRIFELLDESGYEGFVGCEYRPRASTLDGLGWLRQHRS